MDNYLYEAEYAKDYWRFLKIYEKIKSHKIVSHNDIILDSIQYDIINNKDAALAFFLAQFISYKKHIMQKVIIDAKSAKYAYAFALHIKGADIQSLQNIVIASRNIKFICLFGCFIKGANNKKIEKIIIQSKNPKYACMWLQNTKNPSINKIKNIIIKSKEPKPQFLYELAKLIDAPKDIATIERAIIRSGSCKYIRLFAENIDGANINKLEKAIIKTNNIKEIKKFAKIKGSMLSNFGLLI